MEILTVLGDEGLTIYPRTGKLATEEAAATEATTTRDAYTEAALGGILSTEVTTIVTSAPGFSR